MSPVLDTTLLIAAERDPARLGPFLDELAAGVEPLLVPVQCAIEFSAGTLNPAASFRRVAESFTLVPMGPSIGLEAARLARRARLAGSFPGWPDIQIAATASHEGMSLVTVNRKHFEQLGIDVIEHP